MVLALTVVFGAATSAQACESRTSKWCGKRHSQVFNKRAIKTVAKKRGYSSADISRLLRIAKRESHFRNKATNGPCKGMFQLNTRKSKSKWANPYWNTNRAITYIKKRYGSPGGALRHIRRTGWY